MTADSAVMFAMLAALLFWPAYNIALVVLMGLRRSGRRRSPSAWQRYPLTYWIIIPALNEERVVANTVASALALDSQFARVRVLVVDDGSDDATPQVLAQIDDSRLEVLTRVAPHARQGKGEALNAAFRLVRERAEEEGITASSVVGIIDGDGRGKPGMLSVVSAYFADRSVGAVQCRVRIHNRHHLLAMVQDVEFACVVDACQNLRDMIGTVGLGGNGQFVRLTVLRRLGDAPWTSCLVEDLDLGLRVHMQGLRIRYAPEAAITQQGLTDVRRLVRQRTRWTQGNLQCVHHLRALTTSRFVSTLSLPEFFQYLLTPWLLVPSSVLIAVTFLVALPVLETLSSGLILLWLGALLGPGLLWGVLHWLRYREDPFWRSLLAGLLYPTYLLLGVVSAWRALARLFLKRGSWAKTDRLAERPTSVPPRSITEVSPCTAS